MSKNNIHLPENKKFGLFFCLVFFLISIYFFYIKVIYLTYIFVALSLCFLILSFTLPKLLLPLNKLWMSFGYLLSLIIKPIVLGAIFFVIFTPISLVMKIFKRDELQIKKPVSDSYWRKRSSNKFLENLDKQY